VKIDGGVWLVSNNSLLWMITFGETVFVITLKSGDVDVDVVVFFPALLVIALLIFCLIKVYVIVVIKTVIAIEVFANMKPYVVKPTSK
jgi:hypothetical protein